jgi:hypothetical protein
VLSVTMRMVIYCLFLLANNITPRVSILCGLFYFFFNLLMTIVVARKTDQDNPRKCFLLSR